MEQIDVASENFSSLMEEIGGYTKSIFTEQDTRLKILDRVFHEVLGWPFDDIQTEVPSGSGFIDYRLSIGGRARLIVEAKRDGRDLGLNGRAAGRSFNLDGVVFRTEAAREGIAQAIRYCGQKNAELACVSNGREWIVFRGSRLGDGLDTMDGVAFVFPRLEDIRDNFVLFYDLISFEAVSSFSYRARFQEAEGKSIRLYQFRRSLKDPRHRRLLTNNKLSSDLERVMTSFFRRLSGDDDPDFLAR